MKRYPNTVILVWSYMYPCTVKRELGANDKSNKPCQLPQSAQIDMTRNHPLSFNFLAVKK